MQVTPEMVEAIKEHYGLNDPPHIQYVKWLNNVLHGDLGRSFTSHRMVLDEFSNHLMPTLLLNLTSVFVAILIAVPLGIISAFKRNTIVDHLSRIFALWGVSMPNFWLALALLWCFSVRYDIFPLYGYGVGLVENLKHLVLPAIVLGTSMTGSLMRITRSSMLDVLHQNYMTTARMKGLKEFDVIGRHAFKNALIPVITVIGFQFSHIFAGSMVMEVIFSLPGNGNVFINSIFTRDYPIIQGFTLIYMVIFICIVLLIDISYSLIDPRIRYEGESTNVA